MHCYGSYKIEFGIAILREITRDLFILVDVQFSFHLGYRVLHNGIIKGL